MKTIKKTIFAAAAMLAATTTLIMTGCSKGEDNCPYYWNVEVRNETDKEIDLIYWENGQSVNTVKILRNQTGTLTGISHYGPDGNTRKLTTRPTDYIDGKGHGDVPFSYDQWRKEGKSISIRVGSKAAPAGILNGERWGFEGGFYEYTYSLTITNEFLNDLMPGYVDARE